MTQNELSKKLGISRSTYAQYEIGRRQPDYDTLQKLADFFDVSLDFLVGRVDHPKMILTEKERKMYDAVGNLSFEEQKKLFDFDDAEEEDINDIIKQIELIKIRRQQIKSRD